MFHMYMCIVHNSSVIIYFNFMLYLTNWVIFYSFIDLHHDSHPTISGFQSVSSNITHKDIKIFYILL